MFVIDNLAIKRAIQAQIKAAISCDERELLKIEAIPVQLLASDRPSANLADRGWIYRSAIALKLASRWQLNPLELATQLIACLPPEATNPLIAELTASAIAPGWIDFGLSDRGLALWLQQVISCPQAEDLERSPSQTAANSPLAKKLQPQLFQLQYALVRCCSLLRLGEQEGLIQLKNGQLTGATPWFDSVAEKPIWLLASAAEKRLIACLLEVADNFNCLSYSQCLNLAAAFEGFYRSCRIWGEVAKRSPSLSQARLGLVAATAAMLKSLLLEQLGAIAPGEL